MHRDVIHTVAQIWTRSGALPHRQVQKEGQQATWYYHSTFSKFADASKWADAAQVLKAKGIASAWPRLSWTLSWHCHDTVMIMPYIHIILWWACRCVLLHIDRVYAVIAEGWNGKPHPIAEVLDRMLQGHFWLWRAFQGNVAEEFAETLSTQLTAVCWMLLANASAKFPWKALHSYHQSWLQTPSLAGAVKAVFALTLSCSMESVNSTISIIDTCRAGEAP